MLPITVQRIIRCGSQNRLAIYGDAFNVEVLHQALPRASHLIIALPHSTNRNPLITAAKLINPSLKIFVRARYVSEQDDLHRSRADGACFEEVEAAVSLSRMVLSSREMSTDVIREQLTRIRQELMFSSNARVTAQPV